MRHWARGIRKKIATAGLAVGLVASCNVVCAQMPCGYDVRIIQGPFCEPFGFPPAIAKGTSETGEVAEFYSECDDCPTDLSGDCVVDARDLLILLMNWG